MFTKTSLLGLLYLCAILIGFPEKSTGSDPLPTTPPAPTVSPYGNETLPTLFPPLVFPNFTVPTLNPMAPVPPPTFGPIPGLGNFTLPTLGTLPGFGNFTLPTFAPLNLSFPGLPTMAPLNLSLPNFMNFTLPTMPTFAPLVLGDLSNFTLPTLAPFNLSHLGLGTMPTFAPLNLSFPGLPTMAPLNLSHLGLGTMPTFAPLNLSLPELPSLPTMAPLNLSHLGLGTMPTFAPLNLSLPALPTMSPMNLTILGLPTMAPVNLTGLPTLLPITNPPSMGTTTKPPAAPSTACGSATCTSTQVCASPLNSTQTCIPRLPDRRYCIDEPCQVGMKCFDNVTSNAYTCYTKLDGTAGECLGIKCSPGDICFQTMGKPAQCIQLKQAPKCVGANEEFSACKSGCEGTCEEPSPPCMNSTTCTSGCACIRGYVRINGVCELMSKCPVTVTEGVSCAGAEVYTACMPECEKTCSGVPNQFCIEAKNGTATTKAPAKCLPGCTCRPAYKRDSDSGQCVHSRQCFGTTKCSDNEAWSKCHNCEKVCFQTANPSCKACWSGCGCLDGFSRSTTGLCVETAKCF
ncbi:TIL domain-containing protein [Caenorhabditis elegans]|uniref:TIL domain-containing protein n=1 Tax=Caenorhabditis elegans TaxID=6239 RepID=Q9U1U0_CAEEL|nr:TIL domain-containing protein [Caenorhabditis elegans]CAB63407.3 TIL domain-containing protein [Caenorhabditis elegans]|eukprot:NP_001024279.1 Uncharacterized protein CELE_Y69H2.10 [Caenorhabditis elegans]